MQAFAYTFARNGLIAVTFDFLGHGRNPGPLAGSITEIGGATRNLVAQTTEVVAFARKLGDGRLAILGHSMASDIVIRTAQASPDIAATIAVSAFSRVVTSDSPRNLLLVAGGWERRLRTEALRRAGQVSAPEPAREGVTYGSFAAGTARRVAIADNSEHVSVLYSTVSMAEMQSWVDGAFGIVRSGPAYRDGRGGWIALLLAGLVLAALPLSRLLPVVSERPLGAGLGWRRLWPALLVPAIATPLILRVVPTHFFPARAGRRLSRRACRSLRAADLAMPALAFGGRPDAARFAEKSAAAGDRTGHRHLPRRDRPRHRQLCHLVRARPRPPAADPDAACRHAELFPRRRMAACCRWRWRWRWISSDCSFSPSSCR